MEGKVQNFFGQPIPNIEVTFESDERIYFVKTDTNGNYKVSLKKGIYKLFTQNFIVKLKYSDDERFLNEESLSYFRPATRAKINLSDSEFSQETADEVKLYLDIILIESGTPSPLAAYKNENEIKTGFFPGYSHRVPFPKIKYDTILLAVERDPMDIVFQYGYKEKRNDEIYYFTEIMVLGDKIFGDENRFTVVTYDKYTIYAEKVFYNEKKKRIRVENAIVFEIGKEEPKPQKAKNVIIDIGKDKAIIKLEK